MHKRQIEEAVLAREPYLWIGEVVTLDDDRIVARKFLDPSLPLFKAHFVGFPLFPGALQCEAAFQASAILLARTQPVGPGQIPVIARVRDVKFRRMVRPGDTIEIEVIRENVVGAAISLRGTVSVGGVVTTELKFVATAADLPPAADASGA